MLIQARGRTGADDVSTVTAGLKTIHRLRAEGNFRCTRRVPCGWNFVNDFVAEKQNNVFPATYSSRAPRKNKTRLAVSRLAIYRPRCPRRAATTDLKGTFSMRPNVAEMGTHKPTGPPSWAGRKCCAANGRSLAGGCPMPL